jgi:hypothetical protein
VVVDRAHAFLQITATSSRESRSRILAE